MDTQILTILQTMSWAGAACVVGFFAIRDVAAPLVRYWINRRNGVSTNVEARIKHVEDNDLHDIERRLKLLEDSDIRMEARLNKISNDVNWIMGKLNGK